MADSRAGPEYNKTAGETNLRLMGESFLRNEAQRRSVPAKVAKPPTFKKSLIAASHCEVNLDRSKR